MHGRETDGRGSRGPPPAISPAGNRVYVLGATGLLEVIAAPRIAEPGTPVIASLLTGDGGGELAVTPDGKRIYIASAGMPRRIPYSPGSW